VTKEEARDTYNKIVARWAARSALVCIVANVMNTSPEQMIRATQGLNVWHLEDREWETLIARLAKVSA